MAGGGGTPLPELSPLLLVSFVVYFLLGYFLYGALYAAVGSAVNTQQEAQSLAFPVMMPLVLGFVFFPVVLGSPDSPLSVTLSLVPFFTPMLMFLRITAVTPPGLADRAVPRPDPGHDRPRDLGRLAHLPRRHPHVREARHLPEMLRWMKQSSG